MCFFEELKESRLSWAWILIKFGTKGMVGYPHLVFKDFGVCVEYLSKRARVGYFEYLLCRLWGINFLYPTEKPRYRNNVLLPLFCPVFNTVMVWNMAAMIIEPCSYAGCLFGF